MATVLLAETDPHAIDLLPPLLLDELPDLVVDVCCSAEDVRRNLNCWAYDAIAISPLLLQENPFPKHNADRHAATPLLVTASRDDHELASTYLEREALGLIFKPIDPKQAAQTVRLALWQNTLLRLLASTQHTLRQFQNHLHAFPSDPKVPLQLREELELVVKTLSGRNTNDFLMSKSQEERSLLKVVASVAQLARQRALAKLLYLRQKGKD